MLYIIVWSIKLGTCVNNFAYETAEINIEVKHLPITHFPLLQTFHIILVPYLSFV